MIDMPMCHSPSARFLFAATAIAMAVWSPVAVSAGDEDFAPVDIMSVHDGAGALMAGGEVGASPRAEPLITTNTPALAVLAACRAMLPLHAVRLNGSITLRNRRGIPSGEYGFTLSMYRSSEPSRLEISLTEAGVTGVLERAVITRAAGRGAQVDVRGGNGERTAAELRSPVRGTDVTWMDLTLDFLWWPVAVYEADRELESVHGQKCVVIRVSPSTADGGMSVRLWVDRRTGCLMQAEQLGADGRAVRRLWGTRVKKFNGRWMAHVLEVETLGSGHRTKIVIDGLAEL